MEKFSKQLQISRVEADIHRTEANQLMQAINGKQYEKIEECLHGLLTHADQ